MTVLLYLLPLGLIFDLAGYMPPALRLFLLFGLLALPLCLRPSRKAAWLGGGLLLAMLLQSWLNLPELAETALFVLLHQAIWTVMAPVPRGLRSGVVAYALVHFFLFASPLGYPITESLTGLLNHNAEWITGNPFHIGWTWHNLGALILFLLLSLFSWEGTRVGYVRSGSFLLVALLVSALSATVLIEKVDFASSSPWNLEFRELFGFEQLGEKLKGLLLLFFPGFLFLAYLVFYLILHYGKGLAKPEDGSSAPGWIALFEDWRLDGKQLVLFALAAVAVIAMAPPTSWRRPKSAELVFLEKGVVSFTSPDYTRFGKSAGGMFGRLPEYARLFGWESSVVKEVPDSLEPGQVLVITNLDENLGAETQARIWDFVERGGALWVLGDHTFIKNGRNHINDLLEPVHISFYNDSAQFFPQGWFHSYRFLQGTPFASLRDDAENRPGILVGASLELRVPAQPFVLGTFGYSDWGTEEDDDKRGHLGDFNYQSSERLGDLVLVAGERHGKGRVLVFGDTSSFFSTNLTRSFELMRSSLSWLGETNRWTIPASKPGRTVAVLLLLGFVVLVFLWRNQPAATGAVFAAGAVSFISHGTGGLLRYDRNVSRERLAIIDFSHQPNASKHSSMDDGLHGVSINLLRYDLLPVIMNEWDEDTLEAARYIVLNAPRRPISPGERNQLMEFMERGGTVILACGYQDASASRELLEPLGCEIGGTPLGRFFDRPAFDQPVSFLSPWAIEKKPANAAVLCAYDDKPLMIAVPVGDGKLVLIADSEFLHNRNVEGHENHDPANTTFLKNLLDFTSQ